MTLIADQDITEVWTGAERIIANSLEVMSKIKSTYDLCTDFTGPITIMSIEPIKQAYLEVKKRGAKIRMVTEIIPDNILQTKDFMLMAEVRHLEGVSGNFVIADSTDYAGAPETDNGILTKLVVSNIRSFVKQQQYFFNLLWNNAIPAAARIQQIEQGIKPERTDIVSGEENIVKLTLDHAAKITKSLDNCGDSNATLSIVRFAPLWEILKKIKKMGIRMRFITEITRDDLSDFKKLMEVVELRHLGGIHGSFGITDAMEYWAAPQLITGHPPTDLIRSTAITFVKQQQYFFDTLWEKAVPADERVKEIEEGKEPDRLEVIQDTQKSIRRAFELMNETKKEFLILFATGRTFGLAMTTQALDSYRELLSRGARVRVLVPAGNKVDELIVKVRTMVLGIDIRISATELNTRISIMVCDRKHFMSWQLRDDSIEDPYQAGGVATYSSIVPLAESYATIFDNLWEITEFAENLRLANIKLEANDRAMKDFIDMAAHELRTPIQPILGLAENLRDSVSGSTHEQNQILDIIIRNAKRLQQLQEDILDVTKIEGRMLMLRKEKIHLKDLISEVVQDFQYQSEKGHVQIKQICDDDVDVVADRRRLRQVLTNLIGNALKYARRGGWDDNDAKNSIGQQENEISISVTTVTGDSDNLGKQSVIIHLRDSGIGIDPEIQPRLFTKFATKSDSGTGLGLYIAKGIVEAHGGKIWAKNNDYSSGSTFSFSLPLNLPSMPP